MCKPFKAEVFPLFSLFLGEGIATLVINSAVKVRNFFELTKFFGRF